MKILKHGNLRPRKFTCLNCGCEFVSNVTEYDTTMSHGIALWHSSYCPECGSSTEKSEPWEYEDDGSGCVLA